MIGLSVKQAMSSPSSDCSMSLESEVHYALQKGTIDAAVALESLGDAQQWYEDTRYYYVLFEPTFSTIIDIIFSTDVWEGLEPEAQRIIEDTCRTQLRNDLAKLPDIVSASYARLKQRGMLVQPLAPPILSAFDRATSDWFKSNVTSESGLAVLRSLEAAR